VNSSEGLTIYLQYPATFIIIFSFNKKQSSLNYEAA
jgi:hypothetical protein